MRNILNDELGKLETFKNTRGRGLRFSLEHNFKENNISAQRLSNIMLNKHKIIINSKWHRTCFTPAFIISYKQIDFVLDKFIKEFKKFHENTFLTNKSNTEINQYSEILQKYNPDDKIDFYFEKN